MPQPGQATPEAVAQLTRPERLLLQRVRVANTLFDLPRGGSAGQYGRMYTMPLDAPEAADLFLAPALRIEGGTVMVRWPHMPVERAVPVRAAHVLRALQWLHGHNHHYAGDGRVAAALERWRAVLAEASTAGCAAAGGGAGAALQEQLPEGAAAYTIGDQDESIVFTAGGPLPPDAEAFELATARQSSPHRTHGTVVARISSAAHRTHGTAVAQVSSTVPLASRFRRISTGTTRE